MDKYLLSLVVIFVLITPILITPYIHGNDGAGYYAYVRSAFIDGDLDLENEKNYYNQTIDISSITQDKTTEKYYSQYPIGTATLWSPFFLTGHIFANVFGFSEDGYSSPYYYSICIGSAIYAFVGLILLYLVLKKYFTQNIAFLTIITFWLASNLFYYMYFESSMSHAISFFSVCLIIYFWERNFRKRTTLQWILLGFLCGMSILIRYQNLIFLYLPFVEILPRYVYKKITLNEFKKHLSFALTLFLIGLPQMILLKIKHDSFIAGYSGNFLFSDIPKNIIRVLFSNQHGLFNWHLIFLISIIGFIFLYKQRRIFTSSFLIIFLMNLMIVSGWSDPYAGQSFGHRFFINTIPMLCFGLAALIYYLNKKINLSYIVLFCLLLISWNFGLMIQYGSRMISSEMPVPLFERFYNNLFVVPRKLFKIVNKFLFSRGEFLK